MASVFGSFRKKKCTEIDATLATSSGGSKTTRWQCCNEYTSAQGRRQINNPEHHAVSDRTVLSNITRTPHPGMGRMVWMVPLVVVSALTLLCLIMLLIVMIYWK